MVTLKILKHFYKDKTVLVTGHTGFKGSWLMAVLDYLGAKTVGYALAPEYPDNLYNILSQGRQWTSILNDIRNKKALGNVFSDTKPDLVFHLAAQPLVRVSYDKPAETFEVNTGGTANLLESLLCIKKKCSVVVVTTDKVYSNTEKDILYQENDRLGGYDPYSASKACAELVVDSFRSSFFEVSKYTFHQKAIATVRAGNVIGGGDSSKDRIIPDIVNSLRSGTPLMVRNPNAIRPWQHVLEAISGYLNLAMKLHNDAVGFSTAFNLGPVPEDHISVRDLVLKAIEVWGHGDWIDVSNKSALHEAGLLKLDITKALTELAWKPRLNADQAVKWTLEWYKADNSEKSDCTSNQIEKYFSI